MSTNNKNNHYNVNNVTIMSTHLTTHHIILILKFKFQISKIQHSQGLGSVINIFVLHQNRDYGRGRKNCVHETMIPEWMDVVVWGNEHECVPSLVESLAGNQEEEEGEENRV